MDESVEAVQDSAVLEQKKGTIDSDELMNESLVAAYYHLNRNELEQAEGIILKLEQAFDTHPRILSFKGLIAHKKGKLSQARRLFKKVLELDARSVEAMIHLARLSHEGGETKEAFEWYNRALAIDEINAQIHNELGVLYKNQGELDKAQRSFLKAIECDPKFASAYNNCGVLYQTKGDLEQAMLHYMQTIELDPTVNTAYHNFTNCIKTQQLHDCDADTMNAMREILLVCFTRTDIDYQNLLYISYGMVFSETVQKKINYYFEDLKKMEGGAYAIHIQEALKPLISLFQDELLLQLLKKTRFTIANFEVFLTEIRRAILFYVVESDDWDNVIFDMLPFICALSMQCFNNGYCYAITRQEYLLIKKLYPRLELAYKEESPQFCVLGAVLGSYISLIRVPIITQLTKEELAIDSEKFAEVFALQVSAVNEERKMALSIQSLELNGKTVYSRLAYPRFNSHYKRKKHSIAESISAQIPGLAGLLPTLNKEQKILIPWCSTGKEALTYASSIQNANVIAIDGRIEQLSYAKQYALQNNINNISFYHGAASKLPPQHCQFDLIDASLATVNHPQPEAALEFYLGLLKDHGFIKVHLHSMFGGAPLYEAKKFIRHKAIKPSRRAVRPLRRYFLMRAPEGLLRLMNSYFEFYDFNGALDLLFNTNTKFYSLPLIEKMCEKLGVRFLGFSVDESTYLKFQESIKKDSELSIFAQWRGYEKANLPTFIHGYQFWLQKLPVTSIDESKEESDKHF